MTFVTLILRCVYNDRIGVRVNRCFLRRHSRLGVTVVEFDIVAPLFFEVARSGFSVDDDDCMDSRKRTLAAREYAGCDETDSAGSPIFTEDELAMHLAESGNLTANTNLLKSQKRACGKRTLARWILNPSVQPVEMVAARLATRPIPQEYDAFTVDEVTATHGVRRASRRTLKERKRQRT